MDDLISRQAVIEINRSYHGQMPNEVNHRIWKEINELPSAQPEPKWIPWDGGRFPDDSGTYIVTAYDGVKERVTFAKYQKRLKQWELTGARAYWRVLAWMPLPEPYRKEGE